MPGNKFDWVGIFNARRPLDLYGYLGFSYLGALPTGRVSMTEADLGRLAPGRYVAGLFLDDGYALLAHELPRSALTPLVRRTGPEASTSCG